MKPSLGRWRSARGTRRFATHRAPSREMIGVATDISERRRAERALEESRAALRKSEEQLRQAQKMEAIGRLAGGVAHDFNNLLTVILGYADARDSAEVGGDPRPPATSTRSPAPGSRGGELTRQLLAFSRQQVARAARPRPERRRSPSMDTMLRRLIGEDVEFALDLARDGARVHGRPGPDRAGADEPGRQRARRDAAAAAS